MRPQSEDRGRFPSKSTAGAPLLTGAGPPGPRQPHYHQPELLHWNDSHLVVPEPPLSIAVT
jgi:hypothetical protein